MKLLSIKKILGFTVIFCLFLGITISLYSRGYEHDLDLIYKAKSNTAHHNLNKHDNTVNINKNLILLKKSEQTNNPKLKAKALYKLSELYLVAGDFPNAKTNAQKLYELGVKTKSKISIGKSKYILGNIYEDYSKNYLSIEYFLAAYNDLKDNAFLKAKIYVSIANVYRNLENYKEATYYLNAANVIAKSTKNNELKIDVLFYQALINLDEKKYNEAQNAIEECRSINKILNNSDFRILTNIISARIYYSLHEYEQALKLFAQVANKNRDTKYISFIAYLYSGKIYIKQKKFKEAYLQLSEAKKLNDEIGHIAVHTRELDLAFSDYYYAIKQYNKAYDYLKDYFIRANRILDSANIANATILATKNGNMQINVLKKNMLLSTKKINNIYKQNLLLYIIVTLILLLSGLLLYLYANKKKYAAKLNDWNNTLDTQVQEKTEELKEEIENRKEIEHEIKIAVSIQRSILPKVTDQYLRNEFSLSAKLVPALNAAGDFFDFFYLDEEENKIAILIADVSGKGISAAFFMTLAKTVIRNTCIKSKSPAAAFNKANKILSTNNVECMFVTAFLYFYDIKTGEFTYANAGHHNAVLINNNEPCKTFGNLGNLPLGVEHDEKYLNATGKLIMGEKILCYTDGVTEAVSPTEIEFGEENLLNLIVSYQSLSPQRLVEKIIEEVTSFEVNSRFDDITIFVFRKNE
ncbi:MAG: SpoIIE family protein phosphatase [bacterium]|nr:SpoIIE family protein phosphatase [bacterium]